MEFCIYIDNSTSAHQTQSVIDSLLAKRSNSAIPLPNATVFDNAGPVVFDGDPDDFTQWRWRGDFSTEWSTDCNGLLQDLATMAATSGWRVVCYPCDGEGPEIAVGITL